MVGRSSGHDYTRSGSLGGTGEWLVRLETIDGVLPLPARATEVLEAFEVAAEVRPNHAIAHGAQGILQVRVYLDLRQERRGGVNSGE